jgi:hypothetical protein
MARRNPGRAGRSRKRRPDPRRPRAATAGGAPAPRPSQRRVGVVGDMKAAGERPPAPWHPLPLSELLIFVGIVGAAIAWIRGYQRNAALLGAGIGAVAIGTIEVSLREHLGGFRPHTGLLAVVPAVIFHTAVALLVPALGGGSPLWLNYALAPVDIALAAVCFKVLRERYANARRARTAALGR